VAEEEAQQKRVAALVGTYLVRLAKLPKDDLPLPHNKATYVDASAKLSMNSLKLFVAAPDQAAIAKQSARLPVDFKKVLNKTLTPEQTSRFVAELKEDMQRRRKAARRLVSAHLTGKLTLRQLEEGTDALRDGLAMAFRRVTGITKEQQERLTKDLKRRSAAEPGGAAAARDAGTK